MNDKFKKKPEAQPPEGEQIGDKAVRADNDNAVVYQYTERKKIGKEQIRQATATLNKYKAGKASLEKRIISNEQWWKMRHWGEIPVDDADINRPRPASAWLFNSIANKHADAMDNYPEPSVFPREEADKAGAEQLSSILPVLLEHNNYENVYNDGWWYKLKTGTMCQAVLWNSRKENGLGDIEIANVDLLNLFWEPGIKDIQKSRNVFYISLVDNDILEQQYEQLKNKLGGNNVYISRYKYDDSVDTSEKTAVIDWYYKTYQGGRQVLHYCKFCGDTVLYASEDDPSCADDGFYAHGLYPFVLDTLFTVEGSPCGFGYIDIMRDAQMYIDKLGQVVLEHTVQMSRKRFFIKQNSSINEDEFADWRKPFVHVSGNISDDDIREIKLDPLDNMVMNALTNKIEELKETSGNRDFSQGSTTSGVTAASAIAALQEAGSKLSRDMLKASYNAFTKVCYLVIELIRQFYDEPRSFRITGSDGTQQFTQFDNSAIRSQPLGSAFGVDFGERKPIFDIVCKASKKSPFSKAAQNELAKEMYGMGFFNPELADQALACLEIMDFDGKSTVVQRIQQNGTMYQQIQMLQQQVMQLQQIITGQMVQPPMQSNTALPNNANIGTSDGVTQAVNGAVENSRTATARERAQNVTNPA